MTLLAEPPLQADIMMSSSMMESLILELPDWTTKTSFSRTLVRILTLVSPFKRRELVICPEAGNQGNQKAATQSYRKLTLENWVSSALAGVMPRFSHIWPVRAGHELPAKMSVLRIVADP